MLYQQIQSTTDLVGEYSWCRNIFNLCEPISHIPELRERLGASNRSSLISLKVGIFYFLWLSLPFNFQHRRSLAAVTNRIIRWYLGAIMALHSAFVFESTPFSCCISLLCKRMQTPSSILLHFVAL